MRTWGSLSWQRSKAVAEPSPPSSWCCQCPRPPLGVGQLTPAQDCRCLSWSTADHVHLASGDCDGASAPHSETDTEGVGKGGQSPTPWAPLGHVAVTSQPRFIGGCCTDALCRRGQDGTCDHNPTNGGLWPGPGPVEGPRDSNKPCWHLGCQHTWGSVTAHIALHNGAGSTPQPAPSKAVPQKPTDRRCDLPRGAPSPPTPEALTGVPALGGDALADGV